MGGLNQGLPARSSVKTVHRTVFRALRTPNRGPLGGFACQACGIQGLPARCSVRLCHWHNLRALTAPGGKSARYAFLLPQKWGHFSFSSYNSAPQKCSSHRQSRYCGLPSGGCFPLITPSEIPLNCRSSLTFSLFPFILFSNEIHPGRNVPWTVTPHIFPNI